MSDGLKYILRWTSVIPLALVFALLATFPLHWILYGTLVKGAMISGMNIKPIEGVLSPFVIASVFIFSGAHIAPDHKVKVAMLLVALYLAAFAAIFLALPDQAVFGTNSMSAIIGAAVGFFFAKWKFQEPIVKMA